MNVLWGWMTEDAMVYFAVLFGMFRNSLIFSLIYPYYDEIIVYLLYFSPNFPIYVRLDTLVFLENTQC